MLNRKKRTAIILSIFLVLTLSVDAQINIWPYLKEVDIGIPEESLEKIREADRHRQYAESLISISREADRREGIEDGFDELFSASETVIGLLDQYIDKTGKELPDPLPAEMSRPLRFRDQADRYIEMAKQLKEEAVATPDNKKAISVFFMAWDLEMVAILHKARALMLFLDFPVIYEYPWDHDFAVMSDEPRKATGIIEFKNEVKPETDAETRNSVMPETGVHYIIQIAAHTEELSQRQLTSIYPGSEKVSVMFEDGWYKYFIGPFDFFNEAERMMKAISLRNAFIAAYHDGQRISVGEARRREAER